MFLFFSAREATQIDARKKIIQKQGKHIYKTKKRKTCREATQIHTEKNNPKAKPKYVHKNPKNEKVIQNVEIPKNAKKCQQIPAV